MASAINRGLEKVKKSNISGINVKTDSTLISSLHLQGHLIAL